MKKDNLLSTRIGDRSVRRRTRLRDVGAFLTAGVVALGIAACGPSAEPEGPSELRVGISSDISTVAMPNYATAFDSRLLTIAYDSLVGRDAAGQIIPGLATEWEPNDDFTSWTFHLREGVKFHNGETMTAEDVAYDVNAWKSPDFEGGVAAHFTGVTQATAIDDLTVQFDLTGADPRFARNVSLFRSPIVPKSVVEEVGGFANFGATPETAVGAGPYKVVEWSAGQPLVVEAFDDYWAGRASIDRITFIPMPDASTRTAALLSGDIDVEQNFPLNQRDALEGSNNEMRSAAGPLHVFMNINAENGPFESLALRQAANFAIDKESLNENLLGGVNEITVGFALPVEIGFDPDMENLYPYDPDKARELVAEAGYPDGVTVKMLVNTGSLNAKEVGAAIGEMLSDVGITPEILDVSPNDWATASAEKAYDISYTNNGGGGMFSVDDPMRTLFNTERGNPRWTGFYVNPEIEALHNQLLETADDEGGIEIMQEIDRMLLEDAALVNLFQQPDLWGINKDLEWTPHADSSLNFWDARWK